MRVPFLFSIVVHAAIILILYLIESKHTPVPKTQEIPVEIRVVESLNSSSGSGGSRTYSGFSKFLPRKHSYSEVDKSFNHGESGYEVPDNALAEWGEGGGEFGRVKDYLFLEQVQEKVNGLLGYPWALAYNNFTGVVNARMVLLKDGTCDESKTQIHSNSQYFAVYIKALIKKFCVKGIRPRYPLRESNNVDMSFAFSVERDDKDLSKRRQPIIGNVLVFSRNINRTITEVRLGPIKWIAPVPMLYLDFEWIYYNWDKFIDGHDPMNEYSD